jgi:hypothetical protein
MSINDQIKVLQRDGFKCRNCGSRNNLMIHHIVYRSHQGGNEMNNLLTLCASCHSGHHLGHLGIEVLQTLGENDVVIKFTRKGNWRPE